MAWQARLEQIAASGSKVVASFAYYDDAGPIDPKTSQPVVLWNESFTFDPAYTAAQMQAAVRARGAELRSASDRVAQLLVQFPVSSTVIPIP